MKLLSIFALFLAILVAPTPAGALVIGDATITKGAVAVKEKEAFSGRLATESPAGRT